MDLFNMYSVFTHVDTMYGVEAKENDFEDIAMEAWARINVQHTRLYKYTGDVLNGELQLPCNVDMIESVHIPIVDAQVTGTATNYMNFNNILTERYIDAWDVFKHPYNTHGKLVSYDEGNGVLYFDRDYKHVTVVYHGIIVDEEKGLPLITEKESQAITAFVAATYLMKEGIKKKDQASLNLAQSLKAEWLRLCNAARIPQHLSQNDMNEVLEVRTRWDRAMFGKSYKPIL